MNDRSRPPSSSPSPPRIVVAGAAHIDRSGWLAAPSALGCSNPGQFDERPGGTALNIARNLAALRAPVELISLLGRDAAGDWLQRTIETSGITAHVTGLSDLKGQTGTYTSIIEPDGELLVAVADMAIYEQFAADAVQQVVGDLQPTDWLCVDTNLPKGEVAKLLNGSAASKAGVTVSKAKARRLLTFAPQLDVVFTNISEAHALCGFDGDETKPMAEIAAGLANRSIQTAVISNGGQPVTLINGGQIMTIEIEPVDQVADVTGAGDALVGAAMFALTQGQDLPDAVAYGIQAARATIRIRGAICQDLSAQIGSPS
ncbi:MAG: bifunctional hydroxymethylpyrimidine kinase/phosphomethylpyrimidine kinase [Rhizobiaceae bacterium]|nr:PfkB family carbohydrate kinase [Hyphomicrobiales bacterium]NRB31078.1 bifunctional hydroxymethylpyrimidine kinase/phosphomethylpyrimidine kinase [Rhizobiaceae bacterium]